MAETSADSQEVGGSRNPKLNIFCAFLREQTTIADLSTHRAFKFVFHFLPFATLVRAATQAGSFDGAVCLAKAIISSTLEPLARPQRRTASATKAKSFFVIIIFPR